MDFEIEKKVGGTEVCSFCSQVGRLSNEDMTNPESLPTSVTEKVTGKRNNVGMRQKNNKVNMSSNRAAKCTACSAESLKNRGSKHPNDAEVLHPILRVPICNSCFMGFKQSQQQLEVIDILDNGKIASEESSSPNIKDGKTEIRQSKNNINNPENKPYCIWCGFGDGCELYFCDTCPFSFCSECVRQNFGRRESIRVKKLEVWSCYECAPTEQMISLRDLASKSVDSNMAYTSLEKAISTASNKSKSATINGSPIDVSDLSDGEFFFLSLLLGGTNSLSYQLNRRTRFFQLDGILDSLCIVPTYLKACDYISAIFRLSVKLRRCLRSSLGGQVIITPGLFKTEYGEEFQCRLHPHQLTSLKRMTDIENNPEATAFNALRGGIFADEPGLGKTVTSLALITSTAGLLPQRPVASWEKQDVNNDWQKLRGQFETYLTPIIVKICKRTDPGDHIDFLWNLASDIKRDEKHCETIQTFENAVRLAIRRASRNRLVRERLFDILREEMLLLREGLDSSLRKFKHSSVASHMRIRYERSLLPSAATLIIVPQNLLEHWYEQITRHLNLEFFSSDEGDYDDDESREDKQSIRSIGRGVVYLDGLGDIVDVQSPLSKLHTKATINSMYLSTYFIVVTTFERCILEDTKIAKFMNDENDNYNLKGSQLLTIRWLRLIVDEGHELGKEVDESKKKGGARNFESDNAQHLQRFVSNIAAERRWVMSGTPTSGTDTKAGLFQLHRILLFLRHPLWGGCADPAEDSNGNRKRRRKNAVSSGGSSGIQPDESVMASSVIFSNDSFDPLQDYQETLISETVIVNSHNEINNYSNGSSSSSNSNSYGAGQSSSSSSNTYATVQASSSSSSSSNSSSSSAQVISTSVRTAAAPSSIQSRNIRSVNNQESSLKQWRNDIVKPCINHSLLSWEYLIELLSQIMVRHTKDDLHLFEPIYRAVNLGALGDPMEVDHLDPEQERMRAVDRAKAAYIAKIMRDAQRAYKQRHSHSHSLPTSPLNNSYSSAAAAQNRRPKAIVFSPNKAHLQGVGHFLYLDMGEVNLCEHFGEYRSSELSRFRNSRSKFRECPLCGYHNPITNESFCTQTLLAVEYIDEDIGEDDASDIAPEPAGHGALGPGGHYDGMCLCSPHGCDFRRDIGTEQGNQHFPNPFNTVPDLKANPNAAIILPSHTVGFDISQVDWDVGQMVTILPAPATNGGPLLWRGGRMGGRARISTWKPCGGRSKYSCWHPGDQILSTVPWRTQEEDATLLLLAEDGSTGLDLSFATHLFLLERIKDPALHNQIVSRAHRMGATGPVEVTLIQVRSTEGQTADD